MFRDVARVKQKLSAEECVRILKNEVRGVLAVIGDNGYPYAVPMNFFYSEDENKIYFHSGKKGHKIDALLRCDKVSFCVYDQGYRKEGEWALNIASVIAFGKIKITDTWSDDMMVSFCKKFTDDLSYIENEIERYAANTIVLEFSVEHMTGKLVNEA